MKSIQTEILIKAPKEKVWQVLTDFPAYPAWNSFMTSIEGELRVGAQLRTTMMLNGKANFFTPIVQKVEENREFEWLGSGMMGMFKGRHYFRLEDAGPDQTKLIHGEHFSGLLSGLVLRMIGEETEKSFVRWNKALKVRVEG